MSLRIDVQYAAPRRGVPAAPALRAWVRAAAAGRCEAAQLTLRVVGQEEGAALNERYRGGSGPTNVLSFPLDAVPGSEPPWLGDVVLCAPVVERQARDQGKSARQHWAHLVIHGVLHLLGYDHQTAEEAHRMEAVEREVLGHLGYPDPYEVEDLDER
jgi:probable rRNA maturation factor